MAQTHRGFQESKEAKPALRWVKIPYYPEVVKLSDLKTNGKLFDERTIQQIEEKFKDLPDGTRLARDEKNYGIMKVGGKLYAIYPVPLGKGAYGKTYAAQELQSGKFIAFKTQEDKKGILREHQVLQLLGRIEAPVFIRDRGVGKPKRGHAPQKLIRGSSLFDFLYKQGIKFSPAELLNFAKKIIDEVREFHQKTNLLHGDIHIQNILINSRTNKIKLIDFGLAVKKGEAYKASRVNYHWYPPEYNDASKEHEPVDVYQLGFLFKFFLGFPYVANDVVEQNKTALSSDASLGHFLDRMMSAHPKDRPSLSEVEYFIKEMQINILQQYPKKVAIVNLEKYKEYSQQQRETLLRELKKYQEVLFVDSTERSQFNFKEDVVFLELFERCRAQGIRYKDSVLMRAKLMDVREYFDAEQQKEMMLLHGTILSVTSSGGIQEKEVFSGSVNAIKKSIIAIKTELHDTLEKILSHIEKNKEYYDHEIKLTHQCLNLIKEVLRELQQPDLSLHDAGIKINKLIASLKKLSIHENEIERFHQHFKEIFQIETTVRTVDKQVENFQHQMQYLLNHAAPHEKVSEVTKQVMQELRDISNDFNSLMAYFQKDKTARLATFQAQFTLLDDRLKGVLFRAIELLQKSPDASQFLQYVESALFGSEITEPTAQKTKDPATIDFERQVVFLQERMLGAVNEAEKLKQRPKEVEQFIQHCHELMKSLNQCIEKYNQPAFNLSVLHDEINDIQAKFNKSVDSERKPLQPATHSLNLPFFARSKELARVLHEASSQSEKSKALLQTVEKQFAFTLKPIEIILKPVKRVELPAPGRAMKRGSIS